MLQCSKRNRAIAAPNEHFAISFSRLGTHPETLEAYGIAFTDEGF